MTVFKAVVCAAIALVSASGVVAAKNGVSANTPGSQLRTEAPLPSDRGEAKGASTETPAYEMKQDLNSSTTPQDLKGASTFAPGTFAPGHK